MVRLYARALKGKRARGVKPQKRGKNISIITALSLEKVLTSTNIYGSVDGVTFEAFIVKKLVPKLWENACVVLKVIKKRICLMLLLLKYLFLRFLLIINIQADYLLLVSILIAFDNTFPDDLSSENNPIYDELSFLF